MKKLCLILILVSNIVKAETITITADEWCPYNCSAEAKDKGFLVDIFTHIFNKEGYTIKYSISPSYEKAIVAVRENKINALIGPTLNEAPDFIFPEMPMAYSHDVILVHKNSDWQYTSEDSLAELMLGIVKNYEYDAPVQRHIDKFKHDREKVQMISGSGSLEYNLQKLRSQLITAIIDDQLLIQHHCSQTKRPFPFRIARMLEQYPLYIAFSPKNHKSKEYARILNRGLEQIKGTKELAIILEKYGLTEENIYLLQ